MRRNIEMIRSNKLLTAQLQEMGACMEGIDRIKFVTAATESLSTEKSTHILDKLYGEFKAISDVDFGKIAESAGNLAKYRYYDSVTKCTDLITDLSSSVSNKTKNINLMENLHKSLLALRADFEYGFKTGNKIIMTTYNTMVLSLHEMINYCIIEVTDGMRKSVSSTGKAVQSAKTKMDFVPKKVEQFLELVSSGQWLSIMKYFKKETNSQLNEPSNMSKKIALESAGFVAAGAIVLSSLVALLLIIRALVYWFFMGSNSISTVMKSNAEILRTSINTDGDIGIEKRKKVLNILEGVSDFIENRIFRVEKSATAQLKAATKETFSVAEISRGKAMFEF